MANAFLLTYIRCTHSDSRVCSAAAERAPRGRKKKKKEEGKSGGRKFRSAQSEQEENTDRNRLRLMVFEIFILPYE